MAPSPAAEPHPAMPGPLIRADLTFASPELEAAFQRHTRASKAATVGRFAFLRAMALLIVAARSVSTPAWHTRAQRCHGNVAGVAVTAARLAQRLTEEPTSCPCPSSPSHRACSALLAGDCRAFVLKLVLVASSFMPLAAASPSRWTGWVGNLSDRVLQRPKSYQLHGAAVRHTECHLAGPQAPRSTARFSFVGLWMPQCWPQTCCWVSLDAST